MILILDDECFEDEIRHRIIRNIQRIKSLVKDEKRNHALILLFESIYRLTFLPKNDELCSVIIDLIDKYFPEIKIIDKISDIINCI
ncbi:MAG: hypothetical protein ACTSPY_14465 [Candidatus Helarchaeota archaeon]